MAVVAGTWLTGCATLEEPSTPAARRTSAGTVTRDNPGGDAEHPVDAALERLLTQPLGRHGDAWKTLDVQLPDKPNWKGTKFKRYPTRAAYQYGKAYVGVSVVLYAKADANGDSPSACLKPLLSKARRLAKAFDIELGAQHQEVQPHMAVLRMGGKINTLLRRDAYEAALVAHESWPGTCLIQGFAVRVGSDVMLARRVVTRWVEDAAPALAWVPELSGPPPIEDR
jgi:hypothetical protein